MLTTGIFTTARYSIKAKINETNYLLPFGDVHRSSPMHSEEHWKGFLEWARRKKNCTFIGMGDYDDLASTSEREILANPKIHESSKKTFEQLYQRHIDKLCAEIGFMKGRLIGLIEGNHYTLFPDGTTSTQRMCRILGCEYLGCSSFIRFVIKATTKRLTTSSIDIWAHHGKGAARLVGGSLNRVQQMAEGATANLYLMGHDHKKSAATSSKLYLSEGKGTLHLRHKKQLYVRTGGFLKGYEPNEASYIADGCMSPTDLGVVKIELTLKRTVTDDDDYQWIDLHCSV